MKKLILPFVFILFVFAFKTTHAQVPTIRKNASVIAKINGVSFSCEPAAKAINYLSKGIKGFIEKPFFQFNFISNSDERNLLIQVINVTDGVGVYNSKQIEANYATLLNAKEEDFYGHDTKTFSKTEFTLEITAWEKISDTKAKISGKFSGKLNSASNSALTPIVIEGGEFTNITLDILLTQGDIKEMSK